jgi:hypothetical protein
MRAGGREDLFAGKCVPDRLAGVLARPDRGEARGAALPVIDPLLLAAEAAGDRLVEADRIGGRLDRGDLAEEIVLGRGGQGGMRVRRADRGRT